MTFFKKLAVATILATSLTACTSTAELNNEAARSYMGVVQQARAQGAVDTSSQTAKRVHAVFNKMKPYAEQDNKTGVPFNW